MSNYKPKLSGKWVSYFKKGLLITFIFAFVNQNNLFAQTKPYRFQQNDKLGRGVNIGNAFEAPVEGTWGVTIEDYFFPLIAAKGFNSVRIPINWSDVSHTSNSPPYTISSQFFSRIDWVIANALKNKLSVVITMHHYNEFYANPKRYKARFLSIWDQISQHYKNYTDSLYFEVLNEPHDSIDAPLWNSIFPEALSTIRTTNPKRTIIVGGANYNDAFSLDQLVLPADTNLILTVHDYLPFQFTHQGAFWVDGSNAWLGTTWDNTESQRNYLTNILLHVKQYADNHSLPVYIGEFGAYEKADYYSRCLWTNYMGNSMNSLAFSWAYWDFCYVFGLYDRLAGKWRDKLTNSLMTDPLYPAVQPILGNNLLNGNFGQGLSPWVLNANNGASANATITDSICKISISSIGPSAYNIQLTYPGLNFVKGKSYSITFKASAVAPKAINVYTAKNSDPWNNYSDYTNMIISTTAQTYSFTFTMAGNTDNNARLTFDLGGSSDDFSISHVEVREQNFRVAEIMVFGKDSISAITQNRGSLQMEVHVCPVNAQNKSVTWTVENTSGIATISNTGLLQSLGTNAANGLVKVVATSVESPSISGNTLINISGQVTGIGSVNHRSHGMPYPNPVLGNYLYVQFDEDIFHDIEIIGLYDITGKCNNPTISKEGNFMKVSVEKLASGVYFLRIKDNDSAIVLKIVVSH